MEEKKEAALGVFDSGVGGLTVVREINKQMPRESILYYADTAHVPYGSRHPQELKGFAQKIAGYLVAQGCKMIIIACNTSTSLAYEVLEATCPIPLIGVIEPAIKQALALTKNGRIGIIGTKATIDSGVYQKRLIEQNKAVQVFAEACPPFVPLVEKGIIKGPQVRKTVAACLQTLQDKEIDTLILGCTHYPFLQPVIAEVLGRDLVLIDPAWATVKQAKQQLKSLNLVAEGTFPVYNFVSSKAADDFRAKGSQFWGRDLGLVKEINLEEVNIDEA